RDHQLVVGSVRFNTNASKQSRPHRSPKWLKLPHTTIGKVKVQAVLDTGSSCDLVTRAAAKRIGLNVKTDWRPTLRPLWPGATFRAEGHARGRISIDGSVSRWVHLVVVDLAPDWDVLINQKTLEDCRIKQFSPATEKRMARAPNAAKAAEQVPSSEDTPPLDEPPVHEAAPTGNVVNKGMRVSIGLPAGYFTLARDADFGKWDALYPTVARDDVAARISEQTSSPQLRSALLTALM
ncbi:hypothetical protein GQ54DRAFT_323118, partial [Martensiomyces pterosporus]